MGNAINRYGIKSRISQVNFFYALGCWITGLDRLCILLEFVYDSGQLLGKWIPRGRTILLLLPASQPNQFLKSAFKFRPGLR